MLPTTGMAVNPTVVLVSIAYAVAAVSYGVFYLRHATHAIHTIFLVLWLVHYAKRIWETTTVHIYDQNPRPVGESAGAIVYYALFGIWNGYFVNTSTYDYGSAVRIMVFSCAMLVGEMGNLTHHLVLSEGRDWGRKKGRILPRGFGFEWVSCPHYFYECVIWISWFFATLSLAAFAFAAASCAVLAVRADERHAKYIAHFDGREGRDHYPSDRTRLIPLVW